MNTRTSGGAVTGQRSHYTYRCLDRDGYEVMITFALTSDRRMIAVKRSTNADPVYLSPWMVSRIIVGLRALQAQALLGETWEV
jgi:hypothetical protein